MIQFWDGLIWQTVPFPPATSSKDLEFVSKDDTLYLGINTIANNYEVHMYPNGVWTPLDILALSAIAYQTGTARLSIDETNGQLTLGVTRTVCCINSGAQSEVYRWDGTTWNTHGNTDFIDMLGDPDGWEIEVVSSSNYTYYHTNMIMEDQCQ